MSKAAAHSIPEPEEWVDEYGDALFRFAVARIKDPSLAEELVQETFLAALRARENFKGRSSPKTWLIAILKHKIIDHFRKKKPEESREDIERFSESGDQPFNQKGAWNNRPTQWGTNPGKIFEQKEFLDVSLQRCQPEGIRSHGSETAASSPDVYPGPSDDVQVLCALSTAVAAAQKSKPDR